MWNVAFPASASMNVGNQRYEEPRRVHRARPLRLEILLVNPPTPSFALALFLSSSSGTPKLTDGTSPHLETLRGAASASASFQQCGQPARLRHAETDGWHLTSPHLETPRSAAAQHRVLPAASQAGTVVARIGIKFLGNFFCFLHKYICRINIDTQS